MKVRDDVGLNIAKKTKNSSKMVGIVAGLFGVLFIALHGVGFEIAAQLDFGLGLLAVAMGALGVYVISRIICAILSEDST